MSIAVYCRVFCLYLKTAVVNRGALCSASASCAYLLSFASRDSITGLMFTFSCSRNHAKFAQDCKQEAQHELYGIVAAYVKARKHIQIHTLAHVTKRHTAKNSQP